MHYEIRRILPEWDDKKTDKVHRLLSRHKGLEVGPRSGKRQVWSLSENGFDHSKVSTAVGASGVGCARPALRALPRLPQAAPAQTVFQIRILKRDSDFKITKMFSNKVLRWNFNRNEFVCCVKKQRQCLLKPNILVEDLLLSEGAPLQIQGKISFLLNIIYYLSVALVCRWLPQ